MLKTKHIFFILLPAILIVSFFFFIRVIQYEPLYPKAEPAKPSETRAAKKIIIPVSSEDPLVGSARAPTMLIIFEDFGCDRCKDVDAVLAKIVEQYPAKIKIIVKALPVARFPYRTDMAHDYGYCAREQGKYPSFARLAFANNTTLSPATLERLGREAGLDPATLAICLAGGKPKAYREKTLALAETLGIASVPAVFLNNEPINPPDSVEGWKEALGLK